MAFNSLQFILFLPVVFALYWYVFKKLPVQNWFLAVASVLFYACWDWRFAFLLVLTTLSSYAAGLALERVEKRKLRAWISAANIVANLLILGFFKYYNFFAESFADLLRLMGFLPDFATLNIVLPVGISFYTFQALGYSIDVYRGGTKVERDFLTYALFVSFFPQLVAGPIERSNNLLPQFKRQHCFNYDAVMAGTRLMVWGYFMKLVLADRCGLYVDNIFNNLEKHNGGSYLVASLLFPFQIYGDFAGYSLIAIGAARILGFQLMENFRRPYFACTVGDFWHRWHISLSTWFKDYVYIPLGGNRVGRLHNYFNLLATFVVSGIWHGANWTFCCWGALHGLLLCIEKALGISRQNYTGAKKLCHWAVTFVLVCFAWILFRADSLSDAATVVTGIFTNWGVPRLELANFFAIGLAITILFVKEYADEYRWQLNIAESESWFVRHVWLVTMIAYIILFGVLGGDQFIYFQF
jgi:D-alanyl-lipoteichoic acid acyltransferase DltB (MBOAT superfamily)